MINITQQQFQLAQALAGAATLALPPNIRAAATVGLGAIASVIAWIESGSADITDADLEALFAQYEKNKADDLAAQMADRVVRPRAA